jgi:threonine/homoserine/homoserine lactone efflux protein
MTRRATIWMAVAGLFTVINLGGAVYAGFLKEQAHAMIHVVLTIGGAYLMWRIAARARENSMENSMLGAAGMPTEARLEQLQQSIDAVALETERIGEAQRFAEKLRAEKLKDER